MPPKFFGKLRDFIQNLGQAITGKIPGIPSWEEDLQDDIERARQIIMRYIESEQPHGQQEPGFTFYNRFGEPKYTRDAQYPSERTGHTPISEGWFYRTERDGNTLRLRIGNKSEHFWAAVGDPDRWNKITWEPPGPLVFWWGPDLPWRPTKIWAVDVDPPQFWLPWVKRQIPKYNPFHLRAMERAKPEVKATIRQGMEKFIIEVFQSQGFRRR